MSDLRGQSGTPADGSAPVRLLFDQNLSHKLPAMLADVYPGSTHVREIGMSQVDDADIWECAKLNDFTIVSKDLDFHHLSFLHGQPPRIIWLNIGNCRTDHVANVLRTNVLKVIAFHRDPEAAFLILK